MENTAVPTNWQVLADEIQSLRETLENETTALKRRDEDSSESRITRIKAEITEKERLLDSIQGRDADEERRRQAQQDFERANERLAESHAELEKLRAEYRSLPDKLRRAEWCFNEALRSFHEAKLRVGFAS